MLGKVEKQSALEYTEITRLKFVRKEQQQPEGSRETSNTYISVLSVYALTNKAPSGVRAKFNDELQDALDLVPADDILIVLGDFNACVGKREKEGDVWKEARR